MNNFRKKINSLFKPSIAKIVVSILIVIYCFLTLYFKSSGSMWGISPLPTILTIPLFFTIMLGGVAGIILTIFFIIFYSYFLACLIGGLFHLIKKKKVLMIIAILILIFLTGIDEPIVNNTINRPDTSCSVDTDCLNRPFSGRDCSFKCVNQNWKSYRSVIKNVFAGACISSSSCSCVNNKCEAKRFKDSKNLDDCNKIHSSQRRNECIKIISSNINRTNN
jgi:hypothetical protein